MPGMDAMDTREDLEWEMVCTTDLRKGGRGGEKSDSGESWMLRTKMRVITLESKRGGVSVGEDVQDVRGSLCDCQFGTVLACFRQGNVLGDVYPSAPLSDFHMPLQSVRESRERAVWVLSRARIGDARGSAATRRAESK